MVILMTCRNRSLGTWRNYLVKLILLIQILICIFPQPLWLRNKKTYSKFLFVPYFRIYVSFTLYWISSLLQKELYKENIGHDYLYYHSWLWTVSNIIWPYVGTNIMIVGEKYMIILAFFLAHFKKLTWL